MPSSTTFGYISNETLGGLSFMVQASYEHLYICHFNIVFVVLFVYCYQISMGSTMGHSMGELYATFIYFGNNVYNYVSSIFV